ncbi:MAG: hypothetical protein BWX64_01735 [Acidobacteria bacterium ADurb.Bin051]|nr:MAG: hypothetical protein BWX64_01735 [Acidobacteria bacterium ADurb.Bin051]
MLDGEADRRERVLDLVRDQPGHLRPGLQALAAQDFGVVLDDQQARGLSLPGHRHPGHRPLPVRSVFGRDPDRLPLPGGEAAGNQSFERRQPRPGRQRVAQMLARTDAEEPLCRRVGEQDDTGRIEGDHAGSDLIDDPLDQLLFPHQTVAAGGDLPRHHLHRLDERRELRLFRPPGERRLPGGDPPGALDELGERPREAAREAQRERHEPGEQGARDQERAPAQLQELRGELLLLGELRHREHQPARRRRHPRHSQRREELEVAQPPRPAGARDELLPAQGETLLHLARQLPREQPGGVELAPARRMDLAAPVERDLMLDHPRQPGQEIVVEHRVEAETGLEGEQVLPQDPLGRRQRRLPGAALLALEAAADRGGPEEREEDHRHEDEEGEEEDEPARIGADGAPHRRPYRRPRHGGRREAAGDREEPDRDREQVGAGPLDQVGHPALAQEQRDDPLPFRARQRPVVPVGRGEPPFEPRSARERRQPGRRFGPGGDERFPAVREEGEPGSAPPRRQVEAKRRPAPQQPGGEVSRRRGGRVETRPGQQPETDPERPQVAGRHLALSPDERFGPARQVDRAPRPGTGIELAARGEREPPGKRRRPSAGQAHRERAQGVAAREWRAPPDRERQVDRIERRGGRESGGIGTAKGGGDLGLQRLPYLGLRGAELLDPGAQAPPRLPDCCDLERHRCLHRREERDPEPRPEGLAAAQEGCRAPGERPGQQEHAERQPRTVPTEGGSGQRHQRRHRPSGTASRLGIARRPAGEQEGAERQPHQRQPPRQRLGSEPAGTIERQRTPAGLGKPRSGRHQRGEHGRQEPPAAALACPQARHRQGGGERGDHQPGRGQTEPHLHRAQGGVEHRPGEEPGGPGGEDRPPQQELADSPGDGEGDQRRGQHPRQCPLGPLARRAPSRRRRCRFRGELDPRHLRPGRARPAGHRLPFAIREEEPPDESMAAERLDGDTPLVERELAREHQSPAAFRSGRERVHGDEGESAEARPHDAPRGRQLPGSQGRGEAAAGPRHHGAAGIDQGVMELGCRRQLRQGAEGRGDLFPPSRGSRTESGGDAGRLAIETIPLAEHGGPHFGQLPLRILASGADRQRRREQRDRQEETEARVDDRPLTPRMAREQPAGGEEQRGGGGPPAGRQQQGERRKHQQRAGEPPGQGPHGR